MKRLTAILILAALSGCNSIRDFREWTEERERREKMLIDAHNYLANEVHNLQKDVDYMRRHSNPFNPPLKSLREGETARCPFCGANAQRAVSARSTKED